MPRDQVGKTLQERWCPREPEAQHGPRHRAVARPLLREFACACCVPVTCPMFLTACVHVRLCGCVGGLEFLCCARSILYIYYMYIYYKCVCVCVFCGCFFARLLLARLLLFCLDLCSCRGCFFVGLRVRVCSFVSSLFACFFVFSLVTSLAAEFFASLSVCLCACFCCVGLCLLVCQTWHVGVFVLCASV